MCIVRRLQNELWTINDQPSTDSYQANNQVGSESYRWWLRKRRRRRRWRQWWCDRKMWEHERRFSCGDKQIIRDGERRTYRPYAREQCTPRVSTRYNTRTAVAVLPQTRDRSFVRVFSAIRSVTNCRACRPTLKPSYRPTPMARTRRWNFSRENVHGSGS